MEPSVGHEDTSSSSVVFARQIVMGLRVRPFDRLEHVADSQ